MDYFGILTVLLLNLFIMMLIFVFVLLSGRNTSSFLPKRDFGYFLAGVRSYIGDSHL